MNRKICKLIFVISALLCFSGCVVNARYANHNLKGKEKPSLAVLPLENLTNYSNAGLISAQLIRTQIYISKKFVLQDESETRKILKQKKVSLSQLADNYHVSQLGELLGVETVLAGAVTEYGYQTGLGQEPTVGFNIRLVESKSAKVLWAGSYSKVGGGVIVRDSLNNTAHEVVEKMIDDLVDSMKK